MQTMLSQYVPTSPNNHYEVHFALRHGAWIVYRYAPGVVHEAVASFTGPTAKRDAQNYADHLNRRVKARTATINLQPQVNRPLSREEVEVELFGE